jgi:hypothetical protein
MCHLMIVLEELECVYDAFTSRGRDVDMLTSMHCGTQGIAMLPVGRPSVYLAWFLVCNDFAPWQSKSCFFIIHEAMKVSCGG